MQASTHLDKYLYVAVQILSFSYRCANNINLGSFVCWIAYVTFDCIIALYFKVSYSKTYAFE